MERTSTTWRKFLKEAALWALSLILAIAFVNQGISKFRSDGGWVGAFRHWGLPDWFRWLTGVMEGAGGLLVLVPPLARYGAASIGAVMIGAAAVHLTHGEAGRVPVNLAALLLATLLAWGRWRSRFGKGRPATSE